MQDDLRDLALAKALMNSLMGRLRQTILVQLTGLVIMLVQDLGFHISDFLKALATYVQTESDTDPATLETRDTVSSLLETAAMEAERKGRQLP